MDALSHALIISTLLTAIGQPWLIPFAVIGAVIPDADIFFSLISDRDPRLYLFTHGGIAHSVAGIVALSAVSLISIALVMATGYLPARGYAGFWIPAFLVILSSALLHLLIDFTACPGIPLLAPFSDRKYTAGILPGPSLLVLVASVCTLVLIGTGRVPAIAALAVYAAVVLLYLALRAGTFLYVARTVPGQKVPAIDPLRWLVITEDEAAFTVRYFTLFSGFSGADVIEKFVGVEPREAGRYLAMPELRRLRFHSYLVTAERQGQLLVFSDPLRERGYIPYPFHFRRVAVPVP